jgi:hypothetical protein
VVILKAPPTPATSQTDRASSLKSQLNPLGSLALKPVLLPRKENCRHFSCLTPEVHSKTLMDLTVSGGGRVRATSHACFSPFEAVSCYNSSTQRSYSAASLSSAILGDPDHLTRALTNST